MTAASSMLLPAHARNTHAGTQQGRSGETHASLHAAALLMQARRLWLCGSAARAVHAHMPSVHRPHQLVCLDALMMAAWS
jgi:hypothetical protein